MKPTSDVLRIAIVAPPWYPIPPRGYGGIEIVVYLLHNELRRLGHDVTVFGAEGSEPGVEVLAPASWSGDLGGYHHTEWYRHLTYLARVFKRMEGQHFDVIHDHTRPPGAFFWMQSGFAPIIVHTLHEPVEEPRMTFLRELDDRVRIVALSAAQAAALPELPIAAVVHNAVDVQALRINSVGEDYLLEISRIAPVKGQHLAIEVAHRTGRRLILAGKVDPDAAGQRYFKEKIKPYLGDQVEYRGDVGGVEKTELIARAAAGIFPLQWEEPFGLALVECMASGVPVIALARGAAAEIVEPGLTGFLADDLEGLVAGVERLTEINRVECALRARERFSPTRMAKDYLKVYTDKVGMLPHRDGIVDFREG